MTSKLERAGENLGSALIGIAFWVAFFCFLYFRFGLFHNTILIAAFGASLVLGAIGWVSEAFDDNAKTNRQIKEILGIEAKSETTESTGPVLATAPEVPPTVVASAPATIAPSPTPVAQQPAVPEPPTQHPSTTLVPATMTAEEKLDRIFKIMENQGRGHFASSLLWSLFGIAGGCLVGYIIPR
ncbi:MAG: hypothetical protein ACLQUY_07125 [Ktedonobacterales bacterium]